MHVAMGGIFTVGGGGERAKIGSWSGRGSIVESQWHDLYYFFRAHTHVLKSKVCWKWWGNRRENWKGKTTILWMETWNNRICHKGILHSTHEVQKSSPAQFGKPGNESQREGSPSLVKHDDCVWKVYIITTWYVHWTLCTPFPCCVLDVGWIIWLY